MNPPADNISAFCGWGVRVVVNPGLNSGQCSLWTVNNGQLLSEGFSCHASGSAYFIAIQHLTAYRIDGANKCAGMTHNGWHTNTKIHLQCYNPEDVSDSWSWLGGGLNNVTAKQCYNPEWFLILIRRGGLNAFCIPKQHPCLMSCPPHTKVIHIIVHIVHIL